MKHDDLPVAEPLASEDDAALTEAVYNLITEQVEQNNRLDRFAIELGDIRREPGPYAGLASRLAQLESDRDIQRRIMASLEVLSERKVTPTLTVRHWPNSDGSWSYETTVAIMPEDVTSLGNTLGWVDSAARREARRREGIDAEQRGAKALGR